MEKIENPITLKARGSLYIWGIVVAALITPLVVVMQTLGLEQWIPAATAFASAVGVIVGSLARSFLQLPAVSEPLRDEVTYETRRESLEAERNGF